MNITSKENIVDRKIMKALKFVKVHCKCGHVNLIPVYKTLRIEKRIKCEKCGKKIVQRFSSSKAMNFCRENRLLRLPEKGHTNER